MRKIYSEKVWSLLSKEDYFILFVVFFSLKPDGTFPLSKGLSPWCYAIHNIIFVIACLALIIAGLRAKSKTMSVVRLTFYYLALFMFCLSVNLLNALKFGSFGYRTSWFGMIILGVLSLPVLASLKMRRFWLCILFLLLLRAGLDMYAIFRFPLSPERSDMLFAVREAGLRWLRTGVSPYAPIPYKGANLLMPYLPLNFLFYLPVNLWGWDPRIANGLAHFLAFFLFYSLCRRQGYSPQQIFPYLVGLVLMPYWIYRHDLYFSLIFVLLIIFIAAAQDKKFMWAYGCLLLLILYRQTLLSVVPFFLMYHFFSTSDKKTFFCEAGTFITLFIGLFMISAWYFPGMIHTTISFHWEGTVPYALSFMGCFGSFLPHGPILSRVLQIFSFIVLLIFWGIKFRQCSSHKLLLASATSALSTFAFFAPKASNYFYLEAIVILAFLFLADSSLGPREIDQKYGTTF